MVEFVATLIPGVASAWETLHSLIRPPAAAVLAAAAAWHADPVIVLIAALLGGGLAITTHTTKLGLRYAIDASPEPFTNGVANITELALVSAVAVAIWSHPIITLAIALVVLAFLIVMVRLIWRALRQVISGRWMPAPGLMQHPRVWARGAADESIALKKRRIFWMRRSSQPQAGSVRRIASSVIIPLGLITYALWQPTRSVLVEVSASRCLFGLAPLGFTLPRLLPIAR